MNILYISPEFPPNFQNFIHRAHENGITVFAIGESDFHCLSHEIKQKLSWYEKINPQDLEQVKSAVHHIINKAKSLGFSGIDAVESHNEHWLRLEAFINTEFNIEGIKTSEIELWKKKSLMKEAMKRLELHYVEGKIVHHLEEAIVFAKKVGYPIIMKPDEGVGATATFKIYSDNELKSFFSQFDREMFAEKFIYGRMVTYDGLTDWTGKIIFENSLVYDSGVLDNVQGRDTFFHSRRVIPPALSAIGKKIVDEFKIKRKFFHLEFFESAGKIIPLEVNARAPGGPIVDMFNYSSDNDLYLSWAKMMKHEDVLLPTEKKYYCAYAGRKDRRYKYSHEDILHNYGHLLIDVGENPPLFVEGMGRMRYIFKTTTEQELYEIRNYIYDCY